MPASRAEVEKLQEVEKIIQSEADKTQPTIQEAGLQALQAAVEELDDKFQHC